MKIRTTRVETFSDGVIAIIITIMVLELKLPNLNKNASDEVIIKDLINLLPYFIAYILSFVTIGIYWSNHHHMFHLLEKTDEHLLLLNLFSLFWVSLIPITTAILGSNPELIVSSVVYGFVMLMTTLSFMFMRIYTLKKSLLHQSEDERATQDIQRVFKKARMKSILGTLSYVISIPLAFVNIYLAYLCFVIPPVLFIVPQGTDNEALAEEIADKNV